MSDQSAQMLNLLKQIELNTRRNNSARSNQKSGQASTSVQARETLSADDIDETTNAINSQTDSMNKATESLDGYSDAVKDSISYGEKLQEMANESKSSLLAYGKIIDDIFGGKIGKIGKSIFGFVS